MFCYSPKHFVRLIEGQQSAVEEYPNQDKLRKISVRRSDSNPGLLQIMINSLECVHFWPEKKLHKVKIV